MRSGPQTRIKTSAISNNNRVDLDAIEIGGLGVPGRALILRHDVGNLFDIECARPYERNKFAFAALVFDEGLALRYAGRGRDREHVVGLQGRVGNPPDVPKLIEDQSARLMHRPGDPMPRLHLLMAVDARSPGVTLALHRYLRRLAHDQRCRCALRVIAGGKRAWHIARLARPRAGQRRHDDAMWQIEGTKPVRLKQHLGVRHLNGTGRLPDRGHFVHILAFRGWNREPLRKY
jgi:hypothetical protein